jgi:hypothetical protein
MNVEALKAMAMLRDGRGDDAPVAAAFVALARRDMSAVNDALQKLKVDPRVEGHGHRVALLAGALTQLKCDEVVWQGVMRNIEAGLAAAAWRPREVQEILRKVGHWGVYPVATLPQCVERYAASRVTGASVREAVDVAAALCAISETMRSPMMLVTAQRAVVLMGGFGGRQLGGLCRPFARAKFQDDELCRAVVGAATAAAVGEMSAWDAAAVLAFWGQHAFLGFDIEAEADDVAAARAAAAMEALLTRAAGCLAPDAELLISLLRTVALLARDQWLAIGKPVDGVLVAAAAQCEALLAADASIDIETLSVLMPKFFTAVSKRPSRLMPSKALEAGLIAFAEHIIGRVEDMVSAEVPPFSMVPALLAASVPARCHEAATAILAEASAQDVPLPTLQTFRFLLALGDVKGFTPDVMPYLWKSFAMTVEGCPLVQLCTALMCLARAEAMHPAAGDEREELDTILGDVVAALAKGGFSYDVMSLLCVARSLTLLGLPVAAEAMLATHFVAVLTPVASSGTATAHAKLDAAAGLALVKHAADVPEDVSKFLADVTEQGTAADYMAVKPSAWMRENDPSSHILERTPAQLKLDAVLKEMSETRGSDAAAFAALGKKYLGLIGDAHPDDVRFLFDMFAEKVIKQDKILRDALQHLVATGTVGRLSGFSITSILNSASRVRFAYHGATKQLLAAVTDEQWAVMDPQEVELTLSGMSRLMIRSPAVIMALGERAIIMAPTMTARQAASMITAFQQLGVHEDAVYAALLKRCAENANELNSLTLSFMLGSSQSHRLPLTEALAAPLIQRLCDVSGDFDPAQKTRIAASLKKTMLPRSLLAGAQTRLTLES